MRTGSLDQLRKTGSSKLPKRRIGGYVPFFYVTSDCSGQPWLSDLGAIRTATADTDGTLHAAGPNAKFAPPCRELLLRPKR